MRRKLAPEMPMETALLVVIWGGQTVTADESVIDSNFWSQIDGVFRAKAAQAKHNPGHVRIRESS
jgi:hypothetical protein